MSRDAIRLIESSAKIKSFFELNKFLWIFFQKCVFRKACGVGKWCGEVVGGEEKRKAITRVRE